MKRIGIILYTVHFFLFTASGQEIPVSTEQQLENLANTNEEETEDDAYLQELENFRKNPMNLNTADPEELKQLKILTDLQIANLVSYRNLLGSLLSIYELQAVPAWDLVTIRRLLPFITVSTPISLKHETSTRFNDGEHSVLLRVLQVLELSKEFDYSTAGTKYLGSPQRIFFRYRYNYKNLLQFGLTGDKDAGEQFLKGAQQKGFDFYSAHLFARKIGVIQSLALGDFTVNMGQGLVQWQSLAFKKSVDVLGIKRQSAVLRPYSSAGEFYFHRGAGITIRKARMESTVFLSIRKLSANIMNDTATNEKVVSSFLTSGYHRSSSEVTDRNNLTQTAFGGNIIYRGKQPGRWQVGINAVCYQFSLPLQKKEQPYNLYAISGRNWYNFSIDYSYTYKNIHVFGEAAGDKNFNKAFINGVLISVDPRADISLLQRTINASYQSIQGNAFTENTYPTNETGFYTGVEIRPAMGWRINAYCDIFKFPWLKYLVDAPGQGIDFLSQLNFTPNRQVEVYTRYRNETRQVNQPGNSTTSYLVAVPRKNWRTQVNYQLNRAITFRSRVELVWYDHKGSGRENGFLSYIDILYKPLLKPFSGIMRIQYFETDGYNSRIYAYENDVLYSYSIPAFSSQGFRYYLTLNYDPGKKITTWLRLVQTIYRDKNTAGPGPDEFTGNRQTTITLQLKWMF